MYWGEKSSHWHSDDETLASRIYMRVKTAHPSTLFRNMRRCSLNHVDNRIHHDLQREPDVWKQVKPMKTWYTWEQPVVDFRVENHTAAPQHIHNSLFHLSRHFRSSGGVKPTNGKLHWAVHWRTAINLINMLDNKPFHCFARLFLHHKDSSKHEHPEQQTL